MAMDKATLVADVKAALKTAMVAEWGNTEPDYDPFAGILADQIVGAIIQHILDNAETDVSGEGIL